MDIQDFRLAQSIKVKFGTSPNEPNSLQLEKIKAEIFTMLGEGKDLSDAEWSSIVKKYCPTSGHYGYSGLDNSDLNVLLSLAVKKKYKEK